MAILTIAVGLSLASCAQVKKLTGETDDTVLPGARENVLPPDQQTARDPEVSGEQQPAECKADDPSCIAPVDQESSTVQ